MIEQIGLCYNYCKQVLLRPLINGAPHVQWLMLDGGIYRSCLRPFIGKPVT